MKIKKFEKINTIKSTDLEGNWDINTPLNKGKYTGKKNLDNNLGKKFEEIFNNYGFFIDGFGPGDFLNNQRIILQPEEKFREFRVSIGLNDTWDNFLESEGFNEEEFEQLSEDEKNKLKKDFEEQGSILRHNDLEFSVFLPNGVNNLHAGLADAFEYLKLVQKSIPEMYKNPVLDEPLVNNVQGFKKFINNKNIKITNNNIEDVTSINYRLYKDSKFFYELKNVCKDYNIDYEDLINNLLNIK